MDKEQIEKLNDARVEDWVYALAKSATASVSLPFLGSPLAEIFSTKVASPFQRRVLGILLEMNAELQELNNEGKIDPSKLKKDPEFISIVGKVVRAAAFEENKEKLEMLRNIALNTASGIDIDRDIKMMILNLVETTITPSHMKVLIEIKKVMENRGTAKERLEKMVKERVFWTKRSLIRKILRDLYSNGLISQGDLQQQTVVDPEDNGEKKEWLPILISNSLTTMGEKFLKFVRYPD